MATYQKLKLSQDTVGSGIWLGFGPAVTIHTTGTSSSVLDEVWLYAHNNDISGSANIQIEIGGTNTIKQSIPASSGLVLVLPGILVSGTGGSGTNITGSDASGGGTVTVVGYVNRITP